MPALLEPPDVEMAEESAKTRTVRLQNDLVTMLKVIEAAHEVAGKRFKAIEYLDSLTRKTITADYEKARKVIAAAKESS